MLAQPQPELLSVAEYLDSEKTSPVRREYLAGHVFAMAGAGEAHNTIALNLAAELRAGLRGRAGDPCRVFMSDMKVHVRAAETFYYPDILVTCDPADDAPYYKESPRVLVEVLSPSTESTDQREKLLIYSRLESLRDYVLISQDVRRVVIHSRSSAGDPWRTTTLSDGSLRLVSLAVEIPLNEIYLGLPMQG